MAVVKGEAACACGSGSQVNQVPEAASLYSTV